jgi:hypothetical protein
MNLSHLRLGSLRPASVNALRKGALRGQTPLGQQALSRRRFLGAAAGAAGLALAWKPGLARADRAGDPVPIPPCLFGKFDVCAPGSTFGGPNENPSTITDFNGFVGLAYISGMVTVYPHRGASYRLPFTGSDMRFMQGIYRDTQGRLKQGTFALV